MKSRCLRLYRWTSLRKDWLFPLIALCVFVLCVPAAHGTRIKDIAEIGGVRINQLVGYGLVVGLNGTGDGKDAKFTLQSMASMLERMGVSIKPEEIVAENAAAVMVTADLPPFARVGNKIDILVSSVGTASNLQGGTLLLSPLKAADGNVYAVAQGPVLTGGFAVSGDAAGIQKNFPTVGRIVGGATIERQLPDFFTNKKRLSLRLQEPDFTTASRVAQAINQALMDQVATTPDAGTIEVVIPQRYRGNQVELLAMIENLDVTTDKTAKIVINERTGTVIMGEDVRISTVAIAHGNLSIQIKETPQVSQPLPFSRGGRTVVTPETDVLVEEGRQPLFLVREGVSIGEVVRALNAMGVTPRDLMAIFQALKSAGALQAKLEIM